jgi:hypothetical protein
MPADFLATLRKVCDRHGSLVPLVASDAELDRGLDLLEESLADACRGE